MRPPLSPESWSEVRAAYCDTDEPIATICARLIVASPTLYRVAKRQGWPKRLARPGFDDPFKARAANAGSQSALPMADPPSASSAAAPSTAAAPTEPKRAAPRPSRRVIARRLYDALIVKLTQLEELMASPNDKDTIAQARQTRAIAQLIKAFERVTEYDPDLLKSAGSATTAAIAATAAATAAVDAASKPGRRGASAKAVDAAGSERQRKEIADRLERVLEKRNAAGGSGPA